ncbi:neuronal acetylcholine receptor subunit alpha-6-like [Ostrea edulis]|uniref:neuronal acetylcholine receptor subunit alpha-6-like n=1 Tax=Ostrea edulis TaxID=37623 RepID=UPI0024AEF59A|nr:neuronal acetylcholine receptor subunit alpha-6-like [Ostrea edulis]
MILNVSLSVLVSGYHVDVVRNLTKLLFETNVYDKTLRPSMDHSSATQLSVSFHLMSINRLDEVEKRLVSTAYLVVEWQDEFLTWNTSQYPVYRLSLPQTMIWKPDLVLKNGFTEFKELGGSFYYVLVKDDGVVKWKPYQVFESQCSIDVTYFPFDTQTCNIVFTLWSHTEYQVTVDTFDIVIDRDEYQSNSVWEIVSTSQKRDSSTKNTVLTYSLRLKRKPSHFVQNIVLPILFLGILNILVFVIPADAGEKMSYSITVALGFMVFLTIISSELPANSDTTPYISSYLQIQIIMGGVALVVSSLQLRLRHRNEGQKVNGIFELISKISLCKIPTHKNAIAHNDVSLGGEKEQNLTQDEEEENVSWNDVSSAIDFLMFVIYSLVYLISTIGVMAKLERGI